MSEEREVRHELKKPNFRWNWIPLVVLAALVACLVPKVMQFFGREVDVAVENRTDLPLLNVEFAFEGAAPIAIGVVAPGEVKRLRVPRSAMKQNNLSYKRSDDGRLVRLGNGFMKADELKLEPMMKFIIIKDRTKPGENQVIFQRRRAWDPEWLIGR